MWKISKYFIERKDINNDITENEIEQEEYQEKKPGEKLYLTEEEIENKSINIKAEYLKKEKDNRVFYDTVIEVKNSEIESEKVEEKEEEKVVVTLSGYMPEDAEVKVKEIKQEEIEENIDISNCIWYKNNIRRKGIPTRRIWWEYWCKNIRNW